MNGVQRRERDNEIVRLALIGYSYKALVYAFGLSRGQVENVVSLGVRAAGLRRKPIVRKPGRLPTLPVYFQRIDKAARNAEIIARRRAGALGVALAREYRLSTKTVSKIYNAEGAAHG